MQKKLIALAVAGLASTAAFAQSNVTIYGRIDLGGVYRDGDSGGVPATSDKYEIASGVQGGSRIGFKGTEDLGNGLKALFEVEYGIGVDQTASVTNTAATWTNRHSYVGLTGNFGTAIAGRLDGVRYGVYNMYDPFAGGTIANFTQMTIQVDRADNAIAYISPKFFGGFGVVLAYATNIAGPENGGYAVVTPAQAAVTGCDVGFANCPGGNNGDASLQTIMLTYDGGPFTARLDYEQITFPGQDIDKTWVATAGASWDFGVVKLSGLWDIINNDDAGLDQQAWLIGLTAPVGKFALKAMFGQVLDDGPGVRDGDSMKWGLGMDYSLSKRTNLYANYGQIDNDDGAARMINYAANSQTRGYGTLGFDFGIAHKF
jgi:predicted porin